MKSLLTVFAAQYKYLLHWHKRSSFWSRYRNINSEYRKSIALLTEVLNERNFKIDLSLLETIDWHLIRGLQLIINYRGKIISALHSQLAPDTRAKLPARVRLEDAFSQPATLMKSWFSQQVLTALFCQPGIAKITLFVSL